MSIMSQKTGLHSAQSILNLLHVSYSQESSHMARPSVYWRWDWLVPMIFLHYQRHQLWKEKVNNIHNSCSIVEWPIDHRKFYRMSLYVVLQKAVSYTTQLSRFIELAIVVQRISEEGKKDKMKIKWGLCTSRDIR